MWGLHVCIEKPSEFRFITFVAHLLVLKPGFKSNRKSSAQSSKYYYVTCHSRYCRLIESAKFHSGPLNESWNPFYYGRVFTASLTYFLGFNGWLPTDSILGTAASIKNLSRVLCTVIKNFRNEGCKYKRLYTDFNRKLNANRLVLNISVSWGYYDNLLDYWINVPCYIFYMSLSLIIIPYLIFKFWERNLGSILRWKNYISQKW